MNFVYKAEYIIVINCIEQAGTAAYSVNDLEKGFLWFPDIARRRAKILFKNPISTEHGERLVRYARNLYRQRYYDGKDVGWKEIAEAVVDLVLRRSTPCVKRKQD